MAVVTAEQRASKDPIMKEWVAAKDAENAPSSQTAQPISASQVGQGAAATKAGYVPPTNTATPYTGGSVPDMSQINANAATTAAKSPTAPVNYAPTPQTGMSAVSTDTPSTAQPVSANQANTYTPPDYAALAAARTAAALQQKKTIAEQQKASLDRSFARSNEITNDNRKLQDFNNLNSVNRFTEGKQTWDKGIIGRERTLVDETSAGNLQAQKSNIDQLLADYQNATADEQVRIADELQRADRAYNLDLAKFNQGQSNWEKEYGQNQQQIDYSQNPKNPNNVGQNLNNAGQALTNQLNELKLGNYSTEQKQQAALFEQQIKSGQMSNEAAAYNLAQLKDPNSASNQAAKIDLQLKQLDLKNAPETARLKLQQLQKEIAQIGVVHYKPQTQAEKDMDQLQIQKITAEIAKLNNGADKPTPIPSKDSTNNLAYYQDQTDNSTHSKADKLAFAESHQGDLTDADYRTWIASINKSD